MRRILRFVVRLALSCLTFFLTSYST